ncbi:MAG: TonB-dependent receptor plug domain-containing protein [Ginsengibacter sp.]
MYEKNVYLFHFFIHAYIVNAQKDTVAKVIKLSELSLEALMDIKVITATGSEQKISEAPSTMNVITAKQIEDRGYEQLEDALRDIPGIDFIHLNGYAPTLIYFRGMYGAENLRALLMIDGIPENNIIGSNDMGGPAYSLHNVQRIEVIWGPASALYGANAFGGVINIITKKGEDINGLHYEKGYGTFNTSIDKVMYGIKKSNFDIAFSGSLYSTDGPVFSNRDPDYTGSYIDKAYSLNGAITYTLGKLKSTFGFRSYTTPMGWGTFLNSPTVFLGLPDQGNKNKGIIGLLARDVRGEKSGLEEPYSTSTYIQSEFTPNAKLNILARAVYRETGIGNKSYAYLTLDGRKLIRVPTTSSSSQVRTEIFMNYSPDANQQFSAGIQYYRDNVEQGSRKINFDSTTIYLLDGRDTLLNLYSTFKKRAYDIRNNFGSYVQYVLNTSLLGKTNFTIGARYDYNNYYGSPVSPRIAIINKPNDKFTIKLMYGTAYRAPTNTEIYQAPLNFKLKTEKIRTYEINLIYPFSTKFLAQLNGFRNELRDVIILGNLVNLNQDKNPGRININGLEARVEMGLSNNISGFVNFTYQKGKGENLITHLKRNLPGIANVKGNLGVDLHAGELLKLSLIGNWVGKRQVQLTNPYGPVDGYFLTNCVISTEKLFNEKISASIGIRNLFNSIYLDPGFRAADGVLYSTVLEQPERTIIFKIKVNLY